MPTHDLKFYDQPYGHCAICRWNETEKLDGLDCTLPQARAWNPICLMKIQMTWLGNIDEQMRRDTEDGEDWKENAS